MARGSKYVLHPWFKALANSLFVNFAEKLNDLLAENFVLPHQPLLYVIRVLF